MNILFLSRWFPYPPNNGAKIRVFNVLRQLSKQHSVTLISFHAADEPVPGDSLLALESSCFRVRVVPYRSFRASSSRAIGGIFSGQPRFLVDTHSPAMSRAIANELSHRSYDLVIASELDMVPYALTLQGIPLLLEELEIGSYVGTTAAASPIRRARSLLTILKLRRYLRHSLPNFAACTVVSELERSAVQRLAPRYHDVHVISNAVDIDDYDGFYGAPSPNSLVFSGALTYGPNHDALDFFLRDILPTVAATNPLVNLQVTGSTTGVDRDALLHHPLVHFTGYVSDIRPVVARSWATIVPIRLGGGTRLKILESMAIGTPVISTSKGAEGLAVVDGENILIADDPLEFAQRVDRILSDATLREKLSRGGRRLIESQYNWQIVGERLRTIVDRVAG